MDIVIPYKNSSNGLELRYTLRGIEKYFPDLENIFIIGDCPEFLQNVIHIPATDSTERHFKARNIMSKLLIACNDKRVSDSFAMFNDDHFLLKPWQMAYHYCHQLEDSIKRFTEHQTYRNTLVNTFDFLKGGNDFDTHCPIVFRKDIFVRTIPTANWSLPWGYGIKSLYCNLAGIEGEFHRDLKLKAAHTYKHLKLMLDECLYFSIDDRAINEDLKQFLRELFPQKSIYESD